MLCSVHRFTSTSLSSPFLQLRRLMSSSTSPTFDALKARIDYSFVRELNADPEEAVHAPNKIAREVNSGHYVRVAPTPLRAPYLIASSTDLLHTLGLDSSVCNDPRFIRIFSGDLGKEDAAVAAAAGGFETRGWATPYALSIYGSPQTPNGAGRRGYGYGDGRAISIGEVLLNSSPEEETTTAAHPHRLPPRMELQLKGGGTTPFCRGADGSAVLRSSVREFLASEAMHALGVSTTRALCLIASREEKITRPWYSNASSGGVQHGGDIMVSNIRAITTRVARSFIRVGQFELFGRRAARGEVTGLAELELLARHAISREYPTHEPASKSAPLQPALLAMLDEASGRFAALAASWLRVGYVQSNFNSDNCLVGGVTMDYGPFGFLEKYDPKWAMWIGAGDHFSFMNQPNAAAVNFGMFLQSLLPLFDDEGVEAAKKIFQNHKIKSQDAVAIVWANKMGFSSSKESVTLSAPLWITLEKLLAAQPTDYTIIFRQLILALTAENEDLAFGHLAPAFYETVPTAHATEWRKWLLTWRTAHNNNNVTTGGGGGRSGCSSHEGFKSAICTP
jgi:uncharacterized protein YdiU (UPF0061 family)